MTKEQIENAKVNDKWKKRFYAVEQATVEGNIFKINPAFKELPLQERQRINRDLILSDFLSYLATFFFSSLWYLVKGMWLKAIVYTGIITVIMLAFENLLPNVIPNSVYNIGFSVTLAMLAPYDYYRLKILGKQW